MQKVMSNARIMMMLLFNLFVIANLTYSQATYFEKIKAHRDSMNRVMIDSTTTILSPKHFSKFSGLDYYGIDQKYYVTAQFKAIKDGKIVNLKTSGERTPMYKPYGTLSFKLDGKKYKLTLYQSADPSRPELNNYLLLAFTDLTNGRETYGGGRYLEFKKEEIKEEMQVDFNLSFNPYCAYNTKYSCVIPPSENFLNVRIEAGVKKFHE